MDLEYKMRVSFRVLTTLCSYQSLLLFFLHKYSITECASVFNETKVFIVICLLLECELGLTSIETYKSIVDTRRYGPALPRLFEFL